MADWVLAVERAYVTEATGGGGLPAPPVPDRRRLARARAAIGAIASHHLAVSWPRTFGLVADATTIDEAVQSVVAHRTWFSPREIRCADLAALASAAGGAVASLAETLASDIVCIHAPITVRAADLRRGTHVNVLWTGAAIDDELRALATISDDAHDLGPLAAGLVEGRRLDELTVFFGVEAALALAALG